LLTTPVLILFSLEKPSSSQYQAIFPSGIFTPSYSRKYYYYCFLLLLLFVVVVVVVWRVAANILNKSRGQPTRGGPPAWGLGVGLTTPHRKKQACYETKHEASELGRVCSTNGGEEECI
jgi:hypothetical protein